MPQIDFGHVYKFAASVGVLLIVGAVAVPWLFAQSTTSLTIPAAELGGLTETARTVIHQRQEAIAWVQRLMPILSLVLAITGGWLSLWGVRNWRNRQTVQDSSEDIDLSTKRAAFESATTGEIEAKRTEEVETELAHIEAQSPLTSGTSDAPAPGVKAVASDVEVRQSRLELLRKREDQLIGKLQAAFRGPFSVHSNVRISSTAKQRASVVDALLDPADGTDWGQLVVDLRIVGARSAGAMTLETVMRMAVASFGLRRGSVYSGRSGRPATAATSGVILFVFEAEEQRLLQRAMERTHADLSAANMVLKQPIGAVMMSAAEFDTVDPETLRDQIATAWTDPSFVPVRPASERHLSCDMETAQQRPQAAEDVPNSADTS